MLVNLLRNNLVDLPTNGYLNYYWCSGFAIGFFLVIQVVSGIMLSLFYVANENISFSVVMEDITNSLLIGWLIRYAHVWGVSFIFLIFIIHMGRALYYSSYTKVGLWNVGFVLYLLMMVNAFLGYVLPWHQMSYWAATVLTSVIQSVPYVGNIIYIYIVGGFAVTNLTLVRFFALHVILAFVILGLVVVHLAYLHYNGSNNSLFSSSGYTDVVRFHSYYTNKDLFVVSGGLVLFIFILLYCPNLALDEEGFIAGDPMVTPANIKPEWYFLFFYAMLRSVSSKLGGLIFVIIFLILLWLPTNNSSCVYSVSRQVLFWLFACDLLFLSYLGACPSSFPYVILGQLASTFMILILFCYKFFWINNV
uniref:Cytochrome b n=1 Tax=Lepidotrema longipenis TaxID=330067 RepID=A0A346Q019_9PLAT|nr:cytochrome b [Lepidotrema longipenis]AXR86345.1 cytochrome b [Lepidotrema longipenis]